GGDIEIAVSGLADDEDGVVFNNVFVKGLATPITVTASDDGLLDAWVDWNRDGDFLDPGEQVFQFEPLTAGANALAITPPASIPSAAIPFNTYARFRLTRDGVLSPSGLALGGEVEDYQIRVISNAAPTIVTPLVNVITAALGGTTTLNEDQLPGSWTVDLDNAPVFGDVDIANGNGDYLTYTISYAPNSSSPLPILATANGSMLTLDLQPELSGTTVLLVTATDQVGASITDSVTINVTSINDPPEFTPGPSPVAVDEDAGDVTVAPWATNVLPGPAAALDEAQSQTLAFLLNEISRTGNLTFVPGVQPAINPATGDLTFRATANTNGQVVYEVTLKDDGGTANGGSDVSTPVQTLTITVNPVNDAPVLTAPLGIQSVDEDTPLAFSGSGQISVQDLDVAETTGGTLAVTLSATHGTLTLADGTTSGKTLTFTGDVATVNGLLANGTGGFLTYLPDADFNGTDYLLMQVGDQGNTGSEREYGLWGAALYQLDRFTEAEEKFRMAARMPPRSHISLGPLISVLAHMGKYRDAVVVCTHMLARVQQ
ncbi:MAG: GEVED domain-containing protein, partial [Planctomycetes bacterium]|nr:GEVED domain-containing protein [Planctomycetota bacterium]